MCLCVQVKCADTVRCSDVLWFVSATSSNEAMLCCHNNQPGEPMRMTTQDENTPEWNVIRCFRHVRFYGVCVRQLEWQVRPAGHPRTGLNTMISFSGARPDKHFHSGNITDTEWKFGYKRRVTDFHWALLCLCQSGVLLSPWWQCDGPWATHAWRWSHLKWEVCCIIIFVKISFMNTWKLNHARMVVALISSLVGMYNADSTDYYSAHLCFSLLKSFSLITKKVSQAHMSYYNCPLLPSFYFLVVVHGM